MLTKKRKKLKSYRFKINTNTQINMFANIFGFAQNHKYCTVES